MFKHDEGSYSILQYNQETTNFVFIDSLVAYIHNVSPEKRSKRNSQCRYFNMSLQTEAGNFEAVSYRMETKQLFDSASKKKSLVQLTKFKRKANFKNNAIQDIEIGRFTLVTDAADASFAYAPLEKITAENVTVADIKNNGYDKKLVSIIGYVNIIDCYKTAFK